jgi:hypothetical protein
MSMPKRATIALKRRTNRPITSELQLFRVSREIDFVRILKALAPGECRYRVRRLELFYF